MVPCIVVEADAVEGVQCRALGGLERIAHAAIAQYEGEVVGRCSEAEERTVVGTGHHPGGDGVIGQVGHGAIGDLHIRAVVLRQGDGAARAARHPCGVVVDGGIVAAPYIVDGAAFHLVERQMEVVSLHRLSHVGVTHLTQFSAFAHLHLIIIGVAVGHGSILVRTGVSRGELGVGAVGSVGAVHIVVEACLVGPRQRHLSVSSSHVNVLHGFWTVTLERGDGERRRRTVGGSGRHGVCLIIIGGIVVQAVVSKRGTDEVVAHHLVVAVLGVGALDAVATSATDGGPGELDARRAHLCCFQHRSVDGFIPGQCHLTGVDGLRILIADGKDAVDHLRLAGDVL